MSLLSCVAWTGVAKARFDPYFCVYFFCLVPTCNPWNLKVPLDLRTFLHGVLL